MWEGMIHACTEPRKRAFLAAESILLNMVAVVCCKEGKPGRIEKARVGFKKWAGLEPEKVRDGSGLILAPEGSRLGLVTKLLVMYHSGHQGAEATWNQER